MRVEVVRDDRPTLVEVEINPGRANRARINRSPVPRPREVLGLLRTVLFAPEDLALVKGDPSRAAPVPRRPARGPRAADGRRARGLRPGAQAAQRLAQVAPRGGTPAAPGADLSTLDVWDTHLATAGAELLAARLAWSSTCGRWSHESYAAGRAGERRTPRP